MSAPLEWLRVRGMGRERFAGYLQEYLASLGFEVQRTDTAEPSETRLSASLARMNPAIPGSARALGFRFFPTSSGSAVAWEAPVEIRDTDRVAIERLSRELRSHLERAISTETHATAKVTEAPNRRFPWVAAPPSSAPPAEDSQPL